MWKRPIVFEAVSITEAAAIAAARLMGTGDLKACDRAAVDAMRKAFRDVHLRGRVVIGEGEMDEAPMLHIGERVGVVDEDRPLLDIAVDPLEGTRLCAFGKPGAISVLAMAGEGALLHAPDCYMQKVAVGREAADVIDLRESPTWNLERIAKAKGVDTTDLTAVILERPRHDELIGEVRQAGARLRLIRDGDLSGALASAGRETGIDVLFGVGGAPEGVISAAALKCLGGGFQGRLVYRDDVQRQRAEAMGVDHDHIYQRDELAQGDVVFAATGVTDGPILRGVHFVARGATTRSLVLTSRTGTVRYIDARHDFVSAGKQAAP